MKKIILASSSPRRRELIQLLDYPFEIHTREVEEIINPQLSPEENVKYLARLKAEAVAKEYSAEWIIGADTMVCLQSHILGKPKNEEEARKMLQLLSGQRHRVITGVALIKKNEVSTFCETTYVQMKILSKQEIDHYVATGEPLDKAGVPICNSHKYAWEGKAGAYGIQDAFGAKFISGIDGDYYNVVGLPVSRLYHELKRLGI